MWVKRGEWCLTQSKYWGPQLLLFLSVEAPPLTLKTKGSVLLSQKSSCYFSLKWLILWLEYVFVTSCLYWEGLDPTPPLPLLFSFRVKIKILKSVVHCHWIQELPWEVIRSAVNATKLSKLQSQYAGPLSKRRYPCRGALYQEHHFRGNAGQFPAVLPSALRLSLGGPETVYLTQLLLFLDLHLFIELLTHPVITTPVVATKLQKQEGALVVLNCVYV